MQQATHIAMDEATSVRQLVFSDLYLGHATLADRFSHVPGAQANPLQAGAQLRADLEELTQVCRATLAAARTSERCKLVYDGATYLMSTMLTAGGLVFVLRRIADSIETLAELGIPSAYIRCLMGRELSGLLIVAGLAKSGKTTTACALVKERLAAYGGVAITGEELIELPLEGSYGNGVCYQTTTGRGPGGFQQSFRRMLSAGARLVMIDEIRDQETATEALRASVDGYLVISTMVAESVTQALAKLGALAGERMGGEAARVLLADGVAGVMHQQIQPGLKRALKTEVLMLQDAPAARAMLRSGRFDLLAFDIKKQMAAMIAANAAAPAAMR